MPLQDLTSQQPILPSLLETPFEKKKKTQGIMYFAVVVQLLLSLSITGVHVKTRWLVKRREDIAQSENNMTVAVLTVT